MLHSVDPWQLDALAVERGTLAEQSPSYAPPDDALADSLVTTARDLLDDKGWTIFVCVYVLDLSQTTTAEIVGLTQPSVCSRLHYIRRFLRWSATAPALPNREDLDLIPKVKPRHREALHLWLRGFTSSSIARALGVDQSSAYVWCRRAVEKARGLMEEPGRVGGVARAVVARADSRRVLPIRTRDPVTDSRSRESDSRG